LPQPNLNALTEQPHQRLITFCQQQCPATLEMLRRLVAINSFTTHPAGVDAVGALTAQLFEPLGFDTKFVAPERKEFGRHLVMKRSGTPAAPTMALISHLDTVYPAEEEMANGFQWREENGRIHGPGTVDIKGGTALLHLTLLALRHCFPETFEAANWVLLFNSCEEVDSRDFGQLCRRELPTDTRACLVFEADGANDDSFALVAARKGRATFRVEVEGRGAHAGSQLHRGINAVTQLARTIADLHQLTDPANEVTVNVGLCSGGTVVNRVPHEAHAFLEMRAFSPAVYEQVKAAILAHNGPGNIQNSEGQSAKVRVSVVDEAPPWPTNAASEALLKVWLECGEALELKVHRQERGGLSDGNVLWEQYPTLDGLGPRGWDAHCSEHQPASGKLQEAVDPASFPPKAALNALALQRLLTVPVS